jgi:8-hydroxy-5-deazaflavin:NADPH oxidoreductase
MKVTILGTGNVGQTFATKLVSLGHEVMMGTRNVEDTMARKATDNYGSLPFAEWHATNPTVQLGTFETAMQFGELVINVLKGENTLSTLKAVNASSLNGKILLDITNPLDFSKGFPPTLLQGLNNNNSLAEEIQKAFPEVKVVKTLNTMWSGIMVNPMMIGNGDHNAFIAGNDADAKNTVKEMLHSFGWIPANIIDLGEITKARGVEMYLPLWLSIYGATNNGAFNIKIVS